MQVAARSEVGHVRRRNEDSFLVDEAARVFVVADGLGGHPSGDVASQAAVADLRRRLAADPADEADLADDAGQWLADALGAAHDAVVAAAEGDPDRTGMATTAVAVAVGDGEGWVAHVGDSRAYLRSGGSLRPLTKDHGMGGFITQALGLDRGVVPEVGHFDLAAGDRLLVCSDGLTNMVDEAGLGRLLGQGEPGAACDALVEAALAAGGIDNVTVVVVEV